MKPPRVFHIQMGHGGGTERFFVALANAFAEYGAVQAFGLRPNCSYAHEVVDAGEVHGGNFLRRTPGGVLSLFRLRRAIRRFQPDAVMAWRAPVARVIPDLAGVAKLVRLGDFPDHAGHFGHIDAVVCNNPVIAEHVSGLGWPGRLEVISNFARPVTPQPVDRSAMNTPDDAFVVCGSGRFAHNKGFDTLIRAVATLPGAYLWLAGDGDERATLEALADELEFSDRIRFAGWVQEPMNYIASADAFVMPSRDEPLGNALIEAWHAGTASVTTATEGPTWYANDGKDALIVDVDDVQSMAAALARLRDEPGLRETLVSGAKASLAKRFSKEAVVESYFRLISGL